MNIRRGSPVEACFLLKLHKIITDYSPDFILIENSRYIQKTKEVFISCGNFGLYVRNYHITGLRMGEIFEVPISIDILSRLRWLSLARNKLKTLPKSLCNLKKLNQLKLYGNQFENFPKWLIKFLKKIYVPEFIKEGVLPEDAQILSLISAFTPLKLFNIMYNNDVLIEGTKIIPLLIQEFEIGLRYYKLNEEGHVTGIYLWPGFEIKLFPLPNFINEQIKYLKFLEEYRLNTIELQKIVK